MCIFAGGTAIDYFNHITETVNHMADIYSKIKGLNKLEVEKTMVKNVSSAITNKAQVNQATIRLLNEKWGTQLNGFYYSLHPLDAIATKVKVYLKSQESDCSGTLTKNGCVTEQILSAIDKLRYADNFGDPQ